MSLVTLLLYSLLFAVGLVLLYFGAEWTVRGSSTLAKRLGVSAIVIGVTVVAFGTSAPELVVGVVAALKNAHDIALGNVVGSNISNIGLIVGVTGLIAPLKVRKRTLKFELPMVIFTILLLYILCFHDGWLDRIDGAILLTTFVVFNLLFIRGAMQDRKARQALEKAIEAEVAFEEEKAKGKSNLYFFFMTLLGIALLVVGADLMVRSAVKVAHEYFGISMIVIGLTIVAIGTSLPELAASVMAALKKQSDIALGNVLGSNIFNIVLILGAVALIRPLPVGEESLYFDIPLMILFTFVFIYFLLTEKTLVRWEAAVLLSMYIAYLVLLYFRETNQLGWL